MDQHGAALDIGKEDGQDLDPREPLHLNPPTGQESPTPPEAASRRGRDRPEDADPYDDGEYERL